MLKKSLPPALLLLFLATGTAANASVLAFHGEPATASGNHRTLEIDAARPRGDWANATTIGALELENIGSFAGAHAAPGGNMVFQNVSAGIAGLDKHSLPLDFFPGNSSANVPSPLLQLFPGGELPPPLTPLALVSEPRTAAMLLGGLAVMGLVSRRRKGK